MFRMGFEMHSVQRVPSEQELVDWIVSQYRTMYNAFFAERDLIPPGDYHEIGFEDLERNPLEQMRLLYQALSLPDFAEVDQSACL
jgi:hypothetical protein